MTAQDQFRWLHPLTILQFSDKFLKKISMVFIFLFSFCFTSALFLFPPDVQQGEHFKMIFLHVPFAWICMLQFFIIALISFVDFLSHHPLSMTVIKTLSLTGTLYTICCLITGSLWGFPTWGTFWVWDARLTSVLILLLLYFIHFLLLQWQAFRISSFFSIIGLINLPLIKYSVQWWNTLHQGASVAPSHNAIHESISWVLLLTFFAFCLLTFFLILLHLRITLIRLRTSTL